jgi:hypothetical protein
MFTLLVGLQSAWEAVAKMNFEEKNILGSIIHIMMDSSFLCFKGQKNK